MKPCKHCSSSGIYIDFAGYPIGYWPVNGTFHTNYEFYNCKYCGGTGWIDEDEVMTVKREFVKDEYFNTNQ